MNKNLLLGWLLEDLEKNLDNYYDTKAIEELKLEDTLYWMRAFGNWIKV